ncbi:MAG TPA: signal peptidase I [Dissulfurispiraceae bacterium]|nr:signal peptidase I [Dissulfurispiraceae bacterium]
MENPEQQQAALPQESRKKNIVWDNLKALLLAVFIAFFIIRPFIVQAFKIPSGSMIPTLLIGDHLLVNKFLIGTSVDIPFTNITIFHMPGLRTPERGDIVVFKYPEDPTRDFIKRVIAVEGDMIEERNKKIFVNDKEAAEPFSQHIDPNIRPAFLDRRDNFPPEIVPKGKLFVMGDNRDASYDSRFWGYVDVKDLRGKAFVIYWSWDSQNNMPRFSRLGHLVK